MQNAPVAVVKNIKIVVQSSTELYSPRLIIVGLFVAASAYFSLSSIHLTEPLPTSIIWCLTVTLLTAFYWVSGAIPIPVASLIPFVLFPWFGVLGYQQASASFGSHIIILLMGGFMIAKGLEKAQLHKRFAVMLIKAVGARGGKRLILAFMLCGGLLSMWISNSATCLILLPIAMAVLQQVDDNDMVIPLLLGVAFSCNLGGIGTLVGTPTNLVFAGVYESLSGEEFGFIRWMQVGLPVVIIGMVLIAWWLSRNVVSTKPIDLPALSAWSQAEIRVLAIFILVVLLWVFRLEPFGGWSGLTGIKTVGDSTIALLGALLMFIIPAKDEQTGKKQALLDWETAVGIPWSMLILFAGGITIATAFIESGTAALVGEMLAGITSLPPVILIAIVCLVVTMQTEITSNVATTTLLMPILGATAMSGGLAIELLMVPATISASCAFMLPVATAPNAIVFASGQITIADMAKQGVVVNLMMVVVITTVCLVML